MADLRARLKTPPKYFLPFQGYGEVLRKTSGIIFPYSPTISTQQQVNYNTVSTVHSNYQQHAYVNTQNPSIQVVAPFYVQTQEDAAHVLGVMHMLRVITKMHFGENDFEPGTPPPVCRFSAYGNANFENVPVLVGSFTLNYPDDVDYIEYDGNQIPTVSSIALDLLPQYSASSQRDNFRLSTVGSSVNEISGNGNPTDFASGALYKDGFL